MIQYDFVQEPTGPVLDRLLRAGLERCDQFLIALSNMELESSGLTVLKDLESYLISCDDVSEYPAARILDGTIKVCRYTLSSESLTVLRRATPRLYSWAEPQLPNDLCLMRGDMPWLITMAADQAASLILGPDEFEKLPAEIRSSMVRAAGGQ